MKLRFLVLSALSGFSVILSCQAAEYGVVRIAAPVLNSSGFTSVFGGTSGDSLKTDRCGQIRELEYIAPPGTVFTILKKHRTGPTVVYQVVTEEYPAPPGVSLYVRRRGPGPAS